MHGVFRRNVSRDRLERARADVKDDLYDLYAPTHNLIEQFRGEVKAGGWGRHASVAVGVHGLIASFVLALRGAFDVRRERHCTVSIYQSCPVEARQPYAAQTAAQHFHNFQLRVVVEVYRAPDLQLPPWVHHGNPRTVRFGMNEQNFGWCPVLANAVESRVDDTTRIYDHHIVGLEQFEEVSEHSVLDPSRCPIQMQQPAAIAIRAGSLSDEFRWKVVVEVGGRIPLRRIGHGTVLT